jgi:ubiquinone/menaquinone biosynthesis C-methylase UbiE
MSDPDIIRRVNRHAPRYDDRWGVPCESAHVLVLDYGAQLGLQPRRLLDIGCGTGKLLVRARERWPACALVGIDPSAPMLDRARAKLPDATLLLEGAEMIPLEDTSVDLVVSTTSFACWEDKRAGLREVARVLRPGGSLMLADHPPQNWFATVVMKVLGWHLDFQSLQQIEDHARAADLTIDTLRRSNEYYFLHAVRPVAPLAAPVRSPGAAEVGARI